MQTTIAAFPAAKLIRRSHLDDAGAERVSFDVVFADGEGDMFASEADARRFIGEACGLDVTTCACCGVALLDDEVRTNLGTILCDTCNDAEAEALGLLDD